jgi:hypothetical protein
MKLFLLIDIALELCFGDHGSRKSKPYTRLARYLCSYWAYTIETVDLKPP